MDTLNLKAYAKINLALDILGRLPSGYHKIHSIMQKIELHDDIFLRRAGEGKITVDCMDIPDEKNPAYKAAILLKDRFNVEEGMGIEIKKSIPIGAGLSGGSSDAAAVLVGLNKLWSLSLDKAGLMELASTIGMDVPFHICSSTCEAVNRGETLRELKGLPNIDIILINPGFEVSTKEAYESLDLSTVGKKLKSREMLIAIDEQDIGKIAAGLHNDFEATVFRKHPIIEEIKNDLMEKNALNALMSGSGPTVFGIFENKERAKCAYNDLKGRYKFVCLTKTR